MDKQKIKSVVFDLGNVLIDFDHMIAVEKICQLTDKKPEEIFNLFFDSGITQLFEEGKISPLDFFARVRQMLGLRISYDQFVPIWNKIFFLTEKNLSVYNLARQLKADHAIGLISNINLLHFEYVKKTFPLFDVFNYMLLSYEQKCVKPNDLIYDNLLKTLALKPSEVFYTDDRADLIEAAKKKGILAFQFIDIDRLKTDLDQAGIPIN